MGNRAVIAFENKPNAVGIYLHWNGGRPSVQAFLDYAKEVGVRTGDTTYGIARLTQIAANAIGGTLSVGVDTLDNLDTKNGDNGLYIVDDKTLTIKERLYHSGPEQGEKADGEHLDWVRDRNVGLFSDQYLDKGPEDGGVIELQSAAELAKITRQSIATKAAMDITRQRLRAALDNLSPRKALKFYAQEA